MLRTRSQQKKICSNCPIAKSAHMIGDSITLIIVRELLADSKRFGEIATVLNGVSTRTLTQKLKQLEADDVVVRTKYIEKPPRVEYSLTPKGEGLKGIIDELFTYGEKYL